MPVPRLSRGVCPGGTFPAVTVCTPVKSGTHGYVCKCKVVPGAPPGSAPPGRVIPLTPRPLAAQGGTRLGGHGCVGPDVSSSF